MMQPLMVSMEEKWSSKHAPKHVEKLDTPLAHVTTLAPVVETLICPMNAL